MVSLDAFYAGLYNYKETILFYLAIILLVYLFRKHFDKQGIMYIFRTKFGLKFMNYISKKYREQVKLLALIGVGVGYIGMIIIIILMGYSLFITVRDRIVIDGSPIVLPGVPLAGTGGLVFPLVIGWISLFIIMIVHEFSHGIVAKAHNIPIKSSGIVFLGPILGAFVEPDEKALNKASDVVQYSVFAAGPFSNILLTILTVALLAYVVTPLAISSSEQWGVSVNALEDMPAAISGLDSDDINHLNGERIFNQSQLIEGLKGLKPGDVVVLSNEDSVYNIKATQHPNNSTKGYLGITFLNKRSSKFGFVYPMLLWFRTLLFWISLISFAVGLFNLLPIFITDGARMLKTSLEKFGKKGDKQWVFINKVLLVVLLLTAFLPIAFLFL